MVASLRLWICGIVALSVAVVSVLVSPAFTGAEGDASDVDELDLARMMLPPTHLQAELNDFLVAPFSGYHTYPESGLDLGYTLLYATLFESPSPRLTSVGLEADLYDSAASASRDLSSATEELQEGTELAPGVTIEEVTPFGVSGLGDEAFGLDLTLDFGDTMYATDVTFRIDRLVGSVLFAYLDDGDVRGRTGQVAQELATRMKGVLTGDIAEIAAPLPPDVNCAGGANSLDAAILLQYDAGFISTLRCEFLADANGDGRLDSVDAAIVLQLDAGLLGWPLS